LEDPNAPATRGDIDQLRGAVCGDIEQLRGAVRGEIEQLRGEVRGDIEQLRGYVEQLRAETGHQYNDLVERIADSQTALLKAFYGYAEGNNKRVAELENDEAAVRSGLATLEDRILEVERRINMPPAA
jgi:chromosome segregation ATPase